MGETGDVLYTASLTTRTVGESYVLAVGDCDGDGVFDSEEIEAGTPPSNALQYSFTLNATVSGIFAPSNNLLAIAYFGASTNVLYGPCVQSNDTLTVDCGYLATLSREKLAFLFWEDLDGNGLCNAGERKTLCSFPVNGHSMCVTNVLELGDFDVDDDGMLDDWEVVNGLSPTNAADAVQDADGDGFLNLYEYIAGTDPNNAADNGVGTALYAATHGVDDRIAMADVNVSKPYYSNYTPTGAGFTGGLQNVCFNINTNCWMYGVDMSCLSVYDDGPQGYWRHPLTAITAQHVISATHVCPANGLRVTFQSSTDGVVVRTLIAQTFVPGVADSDIWLGLLDSPLPASIKIAKVLLPNYAQYIGVGRKLPLVRIGRDKSCNIHDVKFFAPNTNYKGMTNLETSQNPIRARYWRNRWMMDSGHPLFLLFGDELAFICPARGFYPDNQATGYLCAYYKLLIQRALDGLSDQFGLERMAVSDFDVSNGFE